MYPVLGHSWPGRRVSPHSQVRSVVGCNLAGSEKQRTRTGRRLRQAGAGVAVLGTKRAAGNGGTGTVPKAESGIRVTVGVTASRSCPGVRLNFRQALCITTVIANALGRGH